MQRTIHVIDDDADDMASEAGNIIEMMRLLASKNEDKISALEGKVEELESEVSQASNEIQQRNIRIRDLERELADVHSRAALEIMEPK